MSFVHQQASLVEKQAPPSSYSSQSWNVHLALLVIVSLTFDETEIPSFKNRSFVVVMPIYELRIVPLMASLLHHDIGT
jgi:hypothetical protein